MPTRVDALEKGAHQRFGRWRLLVGVGDCQSTAEVEVLDAQAACLHGIDKIEQPVQCVEVRAGLRDLGADVAVDAHDVQPRKCSCPKIGGDGALMRDAELVGLQAGGDVGVSLGVDVGVDAQADACASTHIHGDLRQHIQFGVAFDVEAHHPGQQRLLEFLAGLSNARKQYLGGLAAGGKNTLQLATRDDVEATPCLSKGLQHRKIGVGLHGVANQVVTPDQGALISRQRLEHG